MKNNAHTIRFPSDLYKQIKRDAVVQHRTFNAQVIHMLQMVSNGEHAYVDPYKLMEGFVEGVDHAAD
jgi:hypothetical protein